jgi:hypothetical protein
LPYVFLPPAALFRLRIVHGERDRLLPLRHVAAGKVSGIVENNRGFGEAGLVGIMQFCIIGLRTPIQPSRFLDNDMLGPRRARIAAISCKIRVRVSGLIRKTHAA